jgi:transcriptional regulator with XRE-family HTH domain
MPRNSDPFTAERLAERLRQLMNARGWTATGYELHKRSGVSQHTCKDALEGRGRGNVRPATLAKYANTFGLTVSEFVGEASTSFDVVVELNANERDVARVIALIGDADLDNVINDAVRAYLDQQSRSPRVLRMLDALAESRSDDHQSIRSIADISRPTRP